MIHEAATRVGTLVFANGNLNTLYLGRNRNTAQLIVWQQVTGTADVLNASPSVAALAYIVGLFLRISFTGSERAA